MGDSILIGGREIAFDKVVIVIFGYNLNLLGAF